MAELGIGQSVRRIEDDRFITGRARYVDDVRLPGMFYGACVGTSYAHAKILSIDTSEALKSPGVVCVLTGADATAEDLAGMPPLFMPSDMGGPEGYRTYRQALAIDKVRYIGDRVAFVVAETDAQARDAAELVQVEYESLPAVVDLEAAVADDAPRVYDDCANNKCCFVAFGNETETNKAFARAAHVVKLRLENNRLTANSLEPRGCIGHHDRAEDQYTLYTSSQNPHGVRQAMAGVFHEPETKFRVISPDVGGGFGMKADAYPEDILVLWASRRCSRPVKWIATRSESLLGDNHGRDQVVYGELALDADGRILAMRAKSLHGFGAYVVSAAVAPLTFAMRFASGVYHIPQAHLVNVGVFANTSPTGPYRGAGRPEAAYLIERLMNEAAWQMGVDPIDLRRRNLIRLDQLPYSTQTGFHFDSGDFHSLLDQCQDLGGWVGFSDRKAQSERAGLLRGRSIAFFIEQAGVFNDQMTLRFDPTGSVTILAGTHSHGQGHATVFTQLVHEWLGLPFSSIRFVQGDTDKVSYGRGTYAARSSMIGGCALKVACEQLLSKARSLAAYLMKQSVSDLDFQEGVFRVADGRMMPLVEVAKASFRKGGIPSEFGIGLEATGIWGTDPPNFPNGCHCCEVEIDPQTGVVRIDRYSAVDDVGRALNPMICEGQIQGGLAQGIGQALMEHVIYDAESAQLLSGSFMDYAMPRAEDLPDFRLRLAEFACKTNPLGVKGVGEAGTIGAPPAVINAVLDALRPLGVKHIEMPASPLKVWNAIQAAKAQSSDR
jgi:aerobic carbon-monoxide dehydrogenase large subunit